MKFQYLYSEIGKLFKKLAIKRDKTNTCEWNSSPTLTPYRTLVYS